MIPRRTPTKARNAEIVAAFVAGATLAALAASFGLSLPRVAQIVHAMGLTRADGGAAVRARLRRERETAQGLASGPPLRRRVGWLAGRD